MTYPAHQKVIKNQIRVSMFHPYHRSIAVISDDTDVLVILLSVASEMHNVLYFRQGKTTVGKGIEYHNVTSLALHLGQECFVVLPGFHALTGSDFTYPFFRRAKSTAFNMMMNMTERHNVSLVIVIRNDKCGIQ